MEHLPVHLPHEALLAGPVHFRWMYPFERFMKNLKGKVKNQAKVEGSIVAGSLTEETSNFTSYYFAPTVHTRKRATRRYDDGGVAPTYPVEGVPDIFCSIGRLSGKLKEVWWSSPDDRHAAHTYILLNCPEVLLFESLFVSQVKETIEGISDAEVLKRKEMHFALWLKGQVDHDDPFHPPWFHDLIQGPLAKITTAPMYFTRGYAFHTFEYGKKRATANWGVCVKGETDFYGILHEIYEVEFVGLVGLKCVLFKCEWFDPVVNRGVRCSKFGVVDVNARRRYNKFEPFCLASQAEQVTFISYPRIKESGIAWLAAIKIAPRGQIIVAGDLPLQEESCAAIHEPDEATEQVLLTDPQNREYEDLPDDAADEERDEFDESDDQGSSGEDSNDEGSD